MIPSLRSTLVAALAAAFASLASAQSVWDNGAGTFLWATNTNWSLDTLPAAGATVQFGDTGVGTVNLGNTTRDMGTVEFLNTTGAYDLSGGGVSGTLRAVTINNGSSSSANTISARLAARGTSAVNTTTFSGTGTASLTLSGAIIDQSGTRATALSKTSSGVLIFSGTAANTYTSTTSVSAGRLELSKTAGLDAISGSTLAISGGEVRLINSNQIINTAAVSLSGGTFNLNNQSETLGSLTISGSSALSLGTGTLALNAATTFASGQTLSLGISNLASFGNIDAGANNLIFAGALNVTGSHSFTAGDSFDLFDGNLSGAFGSVSLPSLTGGLEWNTSALYTDGIISVAAIPEPSSVAALAGVAVVGATALRRRRR